MVAVPESIVQRRLTFEDYLALPDDQDYEIIEGALFAAPRARPRHQIVAARFTSFFTVELMDKEQGTVAPDADLIVDERGAYVSPDIMFFAGDRFRDVDPNGWIRVIPDLIVEVLSPSTEERDQIEKRRLYASIGVKYYWLVDADRKTLLELVLQPDGAYAERLVSAGPPFTPAIFPHLTLDLARLLA